MSLESDLKVGKLALSFKKEKTVRRPAVVLSTRTFRTQVGGHLGSKSDHSEC